MILTEAWKRPVTHLRFERGRNWVSKAVSWFARSYYTHVDLVVDIDLRLFVGAYPYKGVVLHNGTDKFDTEVFFKLTKPIPYELWVKTAQALRLGCNLAFFAATLSQLFSFRRAAVVLHRVGGVFTGSDRG